MMQMMIQLGENREKMTSQVLPVLEQAGETVEQCPSLNVSRVTLGKAKNGSGDYQLSVALPMDKRGYLETALVGTNGKLTYVDEVGYSDTRGFDKPENGGTTEVLDEIKRVREALRKEGLIE